MSLKLKELESGYWLVWHMVQNKPVDIAICRETKDMDEYDKTEESKKLAVYMTPDFSLKFLVLDESYSRSLEHEGKLNHLSLSLIKRKFHKTSTPCGVFNDSPYIVKTHPFRSIESMNEWIDRIPERCTLLVYCIEELDDGIFLRCNIYDPDNFGFSSVKRSLLTPACVGGNILP